jgi:chromosome segregation protein
MHQGKLRNTELESDRNDENIKSVESALVKCNEEIAIAKEEIGRLSGELETYGIQLGEIKTVLSQVDTQKREIDVEYSQKREAIHQVELKIKDDRRKHDDIVKSHHDLDVKIIEATSNIQHIKERAQHEFELDLVLKTYPEDEWIDFAAKREEVKQMKERIRMLGAINFAAFDEYNSESERYNFLSQQRDDLIEAEKTLLSTIEEINNTAQKKFTDTFYLIRENFIKTFKSLFDEGDECDLQLEEGVDPLEAKIEIIAKPRGKRPTSIDLLSGGEKTLTAIALLFAIYLVKPSPFCVLDEVDAPLDDSNIDRYTRIIGKFSDNTQFIVVTHNKRTMEAANALYGITMEEEGVSKIVTVRFNEEARVGSAAIASGL